MTTPEVAADNSEDPPVLRLDQGPLHEALTAIDRARAGIEEARDELAARREELRDVLADEVAAALAAEPDDIIAQVRPALAALYWEEPDVVRVKDLTAATGLSGAQLRKIAGPRRLELPCEECGTPMEVVQTSRSQHLRSRCEECLRPPWARTPWDPDVVEDPLRRLVDHLDEVVPRVGCDGRLTQTRTWAVAVGMDPDALVAEVSSHGAHCDCEVLFAVPVQPTGPITGLY